ncbi:MAG: hypothetical protein KJ601_00060 [Nanoarchaeota archaeon]|nr:hypothetical protein [Nanoarchaeota archaeon]MBU1703852.1 hypothetical protein [Nanoarchaeota archaeon]
MKPQEEIIQRIHNDFMDLRDKPTLNEDDLSALETGLTGLLGLYRIKKTEYLYNLIVEMILFGERHGIDMSASRFLFHKASNA